jgi:hypothetical protein
MLDEGIDDCYESSICLDCRKDIIRECCDYQRQSKQPWRALYGPFKDQFEPCACGRVKTAGAAMTAAMKRLLPEI